MPTGNTPTRSLRVDDDIWDPARDHAKRAGLTMTDLVIALLEDYTENGGVLSRDSDPDAPPPKKKERRMTHRHLTITDDGDGIDITTSPGLTEVDAIGLLRSVLIVTEARYVQHMTATDIPTEGQE